MTKAIDDLRDHLNIRTETIGKQIGELRERLDHNVKVASNWGRNHLARIEALEKYNNDDAMKFRAIEEIFNQKINMLTATVQALSFVQASAPTPKRKTLQVGWVNVYGFDRTCSEPHETRELADTLAGSTRVACVKVEWEEPR